MSHPTVIRLVASVVGALMSEMVSLQHYLVTTVLARDLGAAIALKANLDYELVPFEGYTNSKRVHCRFSEL